jgi:hypothetical protein
LPWTVHFIWVTIVIYLIIDLGTGFATGRTGTIIICVVQFVFFTALLYLLYALFVLNSRDSIWTTHSAIAILTFGSFYNLVVIFGKMAYFNPVAGYFIVASSILNFLAIGVYLMIQGNYGVEEEIGNVQAPVYTEPLIPPPSQQPPYGQQYPPQYGQQYPPQSGQQYQPQYGQQYPQQYAYGASNSNGGYAPPPMQQPNNTDQGALSGRSPQAPNS